MNAEGAVVSIVTVTRSFATALDAATDTEDGETEWTAEPVTDEALSVDAACRTRPSEWAVRLPVIPVIAKLAVYTDAGGATLSRIKKLYKE